MKISLEDSKIYWSLALLITFTAAYFRSRGITTNGIIGSDTFFYVEMAKLWSNGDFKLNQNMEEPFQYFRPLKYTIDAIAFTLFNGKDYSLKVVNALFEIFNFILLFSGCRFFIEQRYLIFLLVLIYGFSPNGIVMANRELAHTATTAFCLLNILTFGLALKHEINFYKNKLFLLTFLSGLFVGMGATVHGSLSFLAPASLGLWILLYPKYFLQLGGLFTIGFFSNHIFWAGIVGYEYALKALQSESQIRTSLDINRLQLLKMYLFDGPSSTMSVWIPLLWLFTAIVFFMLWKKWKNIWLLKKRKILVPISLYLGMIFFFSIVFPNVFMERLFTPLVPLVLISIFQLFDLLYQEIPMKKIATMVVTVFTIFLVYEEAYPSKNQIMSYSLGLQVGAVRSIFNVIGPDITADKKILIAPQIYYEMRRQFASSAYFGQNAIYLIDCRKDKGLEAFLKENNIKFVYLGTDLDRRILESKLPPHSDLGRCFGWQKETYSVEAEIELINQFLQNKGANKVEIDSELGSLYRIN